MHTRKASLRLLTIICFAGMTLLASGCGNPDSDLGWRGSFRPCDITQDMKFQSQTGQDITEIRSMTTEKITAKRPSDEFMRSVANKHIDLLLGYPHAFGIDIGDYMHSTRPSNRTLGYGISVRVTELTDPSTLPKEKRIPNCLDGVPVRIIQQGPNRFI